MYLSPVLEALLAYFLSSELHKSLVESLLVGLCLRDYIRTL